MNGNRLRMQERLAALTAACAAVLAPAGARPAPVPPVVIAQNAVSSAGASSNLNSAQPPVAASEETASSLLQKAYQYYSGLSSLKVDLSGTFGGQFHPGSLPPKIRAMLALARPDRYAISVYLPTGAATDVLSLALQVVSDGKTAVVYQSSFKQYTSGPASTLLSSPARKQLSPAMAILATAFAGQSTWFDPASTHAQLLGQRLIDGSRLNVIEMLSPKDGPVPDTRTWMAVDPATGMLKRISTRMTAGARATLFTEDVAQSSANQPLADSLFTFQPPADVKLVDHFVPPGSQEGGGQGASELVGKPAPDITLRDTNGKIVQLSALKGRTILLDFSASW